MITFLKFARKVLCAVLILMLSSFGSPNIFSASAVPISFEKRDSCVTEGTSNSGERKSCDKEIRFVADYGRFIKRDSISLVKHDAAGSEKTCGTPQFKATPIGTSGLEVPTEVFTVIHTRSEGGMSNIGKRSRLECSIIGTTEKIPSL
ncbi:hypothetical protein I4641_13860 [Waterburya agarophytonicola K14]|uniref:Uncharacterized protein n=1 Tax=Waterburya agarophytonicola KI4 TaxID=2874699 RepID=A0A964BTP8_9CYAN|nr:hypothetical protein [Waterburya agarophytonicola]MCC0178066.1 hypothetical protein [Waterburya agarophytonicola KI4]